MQEAFVGRQPIFDRTLEVYAYELLFRPDAGGAAGPIDGDQATSQVIVNTFTEFGLDHIVGEHLAFINVTRQFLLEEIPPPLPRERVVLEVLEDVVVDDRLVAAVRGLAERGYRIALDDFVYASQWQPLVEVAEVVKLDVRQLDEQALLEHVERLRRYPVRLLAEKVETEEEFERFRELGFDYFQGYFLARPKVIRGRRTPANRLTILRLVARLQNPEAEVTEVEGLIGQDLTLSYRLLRYINSAHFALPRKVESISQAVVYLGLEDIRRWASLIALTGFSDRPGEIVRIALARARMGELLCESATLPHTQRYFTLGLFSALDMLLKLPMTEVLAKLPLATDLKEALLDQRGELGEALHCITAYERTDWPEVGFHGLPTETLKTCYLRAIEWADEAVRELA